MIRQFRKYCSFAIWIRLLLIILLFQLSLLLLSYYYQSIENYVAYKREDEYQKFLQTYFSMPSEEIWQNVTSKSKDNFLVYSAFLDIRKTKMIRALAVFKTEKFTNSPKVWCKFWYVKRDGDFVGRTVEGDMQIINEHWLLEYSPFYVKCPVDERNKTPDAVSVLENPEQMPQNILRIIRNYKGKEPWNPHQLSPLIDKMAVCVKPLHYEYNKVMELLEFIELHKIMGVNHFFLYNHSVGPEVDCLLKKYQEEGIVTVLQWQLPLISQKQIRTEGMFASLNDCLFRTMHKYSHTIFIDLDEFIIPRNHYTYKELFESLALKHNIKSKSFFCFKNSFFYHQWPDDPQVKMFNDPIANNLTVLRKTTRKKEFHPHKIRSKYIVRPELVNVVGNHLVWEYYSRRHFGELDVQPEDAFVHHYRVCEYGGDECLNHTSVVDKTAHKYKDALTFSVKKQYNRYLSECNLADVKDLEGS